MVEQQSPKLYMEVQVLHRVPNKEGKPDKRAGGASKALRRASYDAGRDRCPLPDRYYDSDSIIDGVRFYKDIVNAV